MKTVVVASLLMCVSLVALSKGNIFVQGKDRLPVKAQNFIDVNLEKEGFRLTRVTEFEGKSHEKIRKEVYER